MIRECLKTEAGTLFDADKLHAIGFKLDPKSIVKSRPPPLPVNGQKILTIKQAEAITSDNNRRSEDNLDTEEEEELRDLLSPAYDQLSIQKLWSTFPCQSVYCLMTRHGKFGIGLWSLPSSFTRSIMY